MAGRWEFWGLIMKTRFKTPFILKYKWKEIYLPTLTFPSGLVVVLFPLHLPLSSFSLGTNTVSRFSRKDINILRFPVWEKQVPLLVPPEVRCGSILVCHCTDERAGGKDRLGFVEWSSQEIKSGLPTFWEGRGPDIYCPPVHILILRIWNGLAAWIALEVWVLFSAWCSGLKNPVSLQLWLWVVAVAWMQSLAQELPYAVVWPYKKKVKEKNGLALQTILSQKELP